MTELALRLLELNAEFQNADSSLADEFNRPDWKPRERAVIAAEYADTLAKLVALPPA